MDFNSVAWGYDAFMSFWRFSKRHEALEFVNPEPGTIAIDLGGGTGAYAAIFASPCAEIRVVDLSARMLAIAERKHGLSTLLANASNTGIPDESLDLILICDALHHFPDQEAVLSETFRMLKPGGRLFIHEFQKHSMIVAILGFMERLLFGSMRYIDPEELRDMSTKAGFVTTKERLEYSWYFLLMEKK